MLVFLCAIGIVKIFDPALYPLLSQTSAHVIFQNEKLQQLINDPGNRMHWAMLVIYTVILLVGVIAVTLWSIIGWGAFREINGLSKMQSFIAGMIAFSIGSILIPISLLLLFVLD
jgi:hypothetical protein